jgi:cell division protein ZapA
MSTVNVYVNGRAYQVGCEDGQENHVEQLASYYDKQVREVSKAVGNVGEMRLFLMAALLAADELMDTRQRLATAQAELARLQSDQARSEARAAEALDTAAQRLQGLASRIGSA